MGVGQGAVIALAASRPRVVEAALAVSTVMPDEADELRPAWKSVRAVVAWKPATLKLSDWAILSEVAPGLAAPPVAQEPRPYQVIVKAEHARNGFERALAEGMAVERVDSVGDAVTPPRLTRPLGQIQQTSGRCACGRKALILARCLQRTQDGLLEAEAAEQEADCAGLAAVNRDPSPCGHFGRSL